MKTIILTIAAIVALAVGSNNSAYAAFKNASGEVSTLLTNVSQISKIEVHGNVELFLSDGSADEVKVYNQYDAESALVQSQDGVLRISSYNAEKLVVWVTANDLRAISVYDNASVKSFGTLSKIEFDVNLYNNTIAQLHIEAYQTNLSVNDCAKVRLTGSVTDYCLRYADTASIANDDFFTVNEIKTQVTELVNRDIAGL